jgi:ABC-type transporter Mla subunit MlaD
LYLNAQNEASFFAQAQVNLNVYQDENNELQKLSNNLHIVIDELNKYKMSLIELAKNEKDNTINIISQSINENYKYCRDSVVDCDTNGKIGLKQFKQGKI